MTKHFSLFLLVFGLLQTNQAYSQENSAVGVWKTESSDQGYLHVEIKECKEAMCGTILLAFSPQDEADSSYEHINKYMLWDMKSNENSSWTGGKIWDPTNDKTYKSKMSVEGDILNVSGCVMFFCRSERWTRVQ